MQPTVFRRRPVSLCLPGRPEQRPPRPADCATHRRMTHCVATRRGRRSRRGMPESGRRSCRCARSRSGRIYRQSRGDIGVVNAHDHAPESVRVAGQAAGRDRKLTRSAHIEGQRALLEEDLELQRVRVAERDAGCAEVARGPVGKVHRVAGPIIVLDPFPLVAHFGVGMPATGPSGPSGRQSRS